MDAELPVDVAHVGLGGGVGDEQLDLDVGYALALGEKDQHLLLPGGEAVLLGDGVAGCRQGPVEDGDAVMLRAGADGPQEVR